MNPLAHFLQEKLKEHRNYLASVDQKFIRDACSADNLWLMARHRSHHWRQLKMKAERAEKAIPAVVDYSQGIDALVNHLAAMLVEIPYIPAAPTYRFETEQALPHETTSELYLLFNRQDVPAPTLIHWEKEFPGISRPHRYVLLLRTSGSTGNGRWVGLEAEQILHQLTVHLQSMELEADQNRYIGLPNFHAFGLILDRLLGLSAGQHLIFCPHIRDLTQQMLKPSLGLPVDFIAAVPRQLTHILSRSQSYPDALRRILFHTGGAYVPQQLRQEIRAKSQGLMIGYGLTECGPGVLLDGEAVGCRIQLRPLQSSPNLQTLYVQSPSLGQFSEREASCDQGYFHTGDIAYESQKRIEVVGRAAHVIKTLDGKWTTIASIEEQLRRICQGHELAVALRYDSHEPIATIRLVPSNNPLNVGEQLTRIQHFFRSKLAMDCQVWILTEPQELSEFILTIQTQKPGKSLSEHIFLASQDLFRRVA